VIVLPILMDQSEAYLNVQTIVWEEDLLVNKYVKCISIILVSTIVRIPIQITLAIQMGEF
jgi:hypothetical protein